MNEMTPNRFARLSCCKTCGHYDSQPGLALKPRGLMSPVLEVTNTCKICNKQWTWIAPLHEAAYMSEQAFVPGEG